MQSLQARVLNTDYFIVFFIYRGPWLLRDLGPTWFLLDYPSPFPTVTIKLISLIPDYLSGTEFEKNIDDQQRTVISNDSY